MSNFGSAFDNREWSRKPSEGSQQRRLEPSRHAKRPPLSSMNPISRQGAHSHQREGEEGRRDGVGWWGRQQFNRPSATMGGPGVSGRRNLSTGGSGGGRGASTSQPAQVTPLKTAIKDLYPHQPNTVSSSN